MFSYVKLYVGAPKKYITLPYSAITFNPYGSIIYILTKTNKTQNGKEIWKAKQRFVSTGETHGNVVAVTKGIKEGDMVVTSGQLKLRNNTLVTINKYQCDKTEIDSMNITDIFYKAPYSFNRDKHIYSGSRFAINRTTPNSAVPNIRKHRH